jgi:hypothetical protein
MTRIIISVIVCVALLATSEMRAGARGIVADTGQSNGTPNGNGWISLVCPAPAGSSLPCAGGTLPDATILPAGLHINPLSAANPVAISTLAGLAPPAMLAPTIVFAGWGASFSPAVSLIPAGADPDGYDDAQTYPPFVIEPPSCYFCNTTVNAGAVALGLDLEWWATGANSATAQVIFFYLGTPSTTLDTTIYDSSWQPGDNLDIPPQHSYGPANGTWEIEFNCALSGCGGDGTGASLLWNGILYTAPASVLIATSVDGVSSPNENPIPILFNEFVFNNGVLYSPPGWTATTITVPGELAAVPGSGVVTLTWSAQTGATRYNVYESSTPAGAQTETPASTPGAVIKGLTNGQTYYFTVTAVYNGVESNQSTPPISATVLAAMPTGLTPNAGNGAVTLSWDASTGATAYYVYEGTSPGGEGQNAVKSSSGTTATISPLSNGQTYYFTVKAGDAGGMSASSNEVSATPMALMITKSGGGGATGFTDLILLAALVVLRLPQTHRRLTPFERSNAVMNS